MVTTVTITLVSFIIVMVSRGGWSKSAGTHAILGIITIILAILNPIGALFRPEKFSGMVYSLKMFFQSRRFYIYSGGRNVVILNVVAFLDFPRNLSKVNKKNPLGRPNVVVFSELGAYSKTTKFRPPLYVIFGISLINQNKSQPGVLQRDSFLKWLFNFDILYCNNFPWYGSGPIRFGPLGDATFFFSSYFHWSYWYDL